MIFYILDILFILQMISFQQHHLVVKLFWFILIIKSMWFDILCLRVLITTKNLGFNLDLLTASLSWENLLKSFNKKILSQKIADNYQLQLTMTSTSHPLLFILLRRLKKKTWFSKRWSNTQLKNNKYFEMFLSAILV